MAKGSTGHVCRVRVALMRSPPGLAGGHETEDRATDQGWQGGPDTQAGEHYSKVPML